LIEALSVFSALLHDFGKASIFFQEKLKGDKSKIKIKGNPLRHEWVSVLFLVAIVGNKSDEEWLSELALSNNLNNTISKLKLVNLKNPLADLPPVASMIAWLILTHHKMPEIKKYSYKQINLKQILEVIDKNWGYKTSSENDYKKYLNDCLECLELPSQSIEWQAKIKQYAVQLKNNIHQFEAIFNSDGLRLIMLYSRLSLMLGDHYYSSLDKNQTDKWHSNLKLFANTDKNGKLKQQLDEHLVRVAGQSKLNVSKLPDFEGVFNRKIRIENKAKLQEKSPKSFQWQDKAVTEIKKWRKNEDNLDKHQFGFFAVNMASTGKGKTFANAKIMQALSADEASLRYILALGLRTLTLQTGDEYKKSIGLNDEELAILIGSNAILNLHNKKMQTEISKEKKSGSESAENLVNDELIFNGSFDEDGLKTILKNKKDRQFLHAPILTCTIDYIIRATETTRGGGYILPTMRLMSSDLVIDEIDDFDGTDLIAIGRLIHLAGMLGRKVMISSATIPPDLAEGYFNAYQSGWNIFAKMRNKNKNIGCAWIDEFKTNVESVSSKEMYQKTHQKFIEKRIKNLDQESAKRKVNIVKCVTDLAEFPNNYFATIKDEICNKHKYHCFTDKVTGKKISIGVVRMANVTPCIKLTKFLLNNSTTYSVEIKAMAYHSRQVLLMRHNQEQYLDKILKRKDADNPNQFILADEIIRQHIDNSNFENIVFVLVVTPVEEVGRDHDFDWAVIEPSSYRSFVQLAGRVLRHRNVYPDKANIGILQYNYRVIKTEGKELAFIYPGYQQNKDDLSSYDLEKLINQNELAQKLDATNRIQKTNTSDLANLEHKVIADLLTNYKQKGAKTMQGWIDDAWWLSGIHQLYIKFRQSSLDEIQFLTIDDGFCKKSQTSRAVTQNNIEIYELKEQELNNLWFERNYETLLKQQAGDKDTEKTALIYGEITLLTYGKPPKEKQFIYNSQLGLCEKN
jgi:CRISPR-associated endonuclease/helicase Cas3